MKTIDINLTPSLKIKANKAFGFFLLIAAATISGDLNQDAQSKMHHNAFRINSLSPLVTSKNEKELNKLGQIPLSYYQSENILKQEIAKTQIQQGNYFLALVGVAEGFKPNIYRCNFSTNMNKMMLKFDYYGKLEKPNRSHFI